VSRRTLEFVPIPDKMVKPVDRVDIDGAARLTLSTRRLYNQLLAHAFGPNMGKDGHEWTISTAQLRGSHKSNERIEDSIVALMKTIVTVRFANGTTHRVALLGGNDMGTPERARGQFTYAFDERLVPLLRESSVFGKLELAVIHAFSTKYGLALYEAIARRLRLRDRFHEDFSLEAFRKVLGVPEGKLTTFSNLKLRAITPAVEEINAIASVGCRVEPYKQGRKVVGVRLHWWRKGMSGLKGTYAEPKRPQQARHDRQVKNVPEPRPRA